MNRADRKRQALRAGLAGAAPVVAVGAHDAMSARLIDSYGFDAVWVSGFGVSAMAYGLPDLNLITMTETLDVTRRIDGVTDLPVVVDCDNGYGGFSNVVRTVVEFDRAGVAAVCIEDNLFPKRNSLYQGQSHARAHRDLGAGPTAAGREGGPGVGALRAHRAGGGADRRSRRRRGDASAPSPTPRQARTPS